MDKEIVAALARRAGLEKALKDFPDDVSAAAHQAEGAQQKMMPSTDPRAEPWPAMKPGETL